MVSFIFLANAALSSISDTSMVRLFDSTIHIYQGFLGNL